MTVTIVRRGFGGVVEPGKGHGPIVGLFFNREDLAEWLTGLYGTPSVWGDERVGVLSGSGKPSWGEHLNIELQYGDAYRSEAA